MEDPSPKRLQQYRKSALLHPPERSNGLDFYREINHFKIRLETLEKERYELEEKVRRLEIENTSYKNSFINGDNNCTASQFTSTLNGHTFPSAVAENDIERLKQRIESLVQSNAEKERKIEDLQIQLNKCQRAPINTFPKRSGYEADGDISDSNSIPSQKGGRISRSSRKSSSHNDHDCPLNSYQNPLAKLKLHILHRASSAEPMLTRQTSIMKRTVEPINSKYDQSGYVSDSSTGKYSMYSSSNLDKRKSSSVKGLKSLFGRIIRTHSGHFRNDHEQQTSSFFQRGSLRATTSHSKLPSKSLSALETTFARWPTEQVVNWLYGIGLGEYAVECRKYFKNGLQLLHATPQELEKKIGMRNPLHRKKLQLCLNGLSAQQNELNCTLNLHWVQKWLDDIGLPQYKEEFMQSKIDGRLLNHLSLDDMIYLNITSEIHHLSLKRSIEVLRLNHFNPISLKRRSSIHDENNLNEMMSWSNHRVMEWLKSIDLSEYAPNLRGSGVCGALIILEDRFNTTTLAEVLAIPLSKTLLRRHLSMHFHELIGSDLQTRKNQCDKSPLTLHTKVKLPRSGLFAHRRTRSIETNDFICPMQENGPIQHQPSPKLPRSRRSTDTSAETLVLVYQSPTTVV